MRTRCAGFVDTGRAPWADGNAVVAVSLTAGFNVATATATLVPYATVNWDPGGHFVSASSAVRIPRTGPYHITAGIYMGASMPGELHVRVNGTRSYGLCNFGSEATYRGDAVLVFTEGQLVSIGVMQYSGSTVTIPSNSFWSHWGITALKSPR